MRAQFLFGLAVVSAVAAATPALAKNANVTKNDKYLAEETVNISDDPWECFNRPVFQFNLAFDKGIAKPFITMYDAVLPLDVRHAVGNVVSNLGEPLNAVHGALQLKPKIFFTSMWRFILNSTFGFAGIRDFARQDAGLHNMDQNLGKTLGHWGIGTGPYLVLPILGPSSARDTTGRVGDWFLDPVGWVMTTPEDVAESVVQGIDTRDSNAGVIEHLYYESLDPYVATRSTYRQHELFQGKTQE